MKKDQSLAQGDPAGFQTAEAQAGSHAHRLNSLRAAVLGANDGIVSTASLITGVAAAQASHEAILTSGLAGLVAGALSMAAGEYVSVRSQADIEAADLRMEQRSLKRNSGEELEELVEIYVERGLSHDLAEQVAQQLTRHDALDAHARDELGISLHNRARPVQAALPADRIAAALGLTASELGLENHAASAFSAGVSFAFVPVRDMKAVGRARPVTSAWAAAFGDLLGAFVYCREVTSNTRHFHARMFAPGAGIVEDPATGAAAAAFAGVIAKFDQPPGGSHRYVIEQGFEMGRPSMIGLEIDMDGGDAAAVRISGDAVIVGRGSLDV